eukprot:5665086-Heterocapsa_arctica.AAC.1
MEKSPAERTAALSRGTAPRVQSGTPNPDDALARQGRPRSSTAPRRRRCVEAAIDDVDDVSRRRASPATTAPGPTHVELLHLVGRVRRGRSPAPTPTSPCGVCPTERTEWEHSSSPEQRFATKSKSCRRQ